MCVIKKTISATSVTSHTHESKMAMYCFGCGCDITDLRVKRSSYSDAPEHVRPLWCEIFEKELVIKGIEVQAQRLITVTNPMMTTIEFVTVYAISRNAERIQCGIFR